MADTYAPYFANREIWLNISFGGAPMLASLVKINDVTTKDAWKQQKSKESSGNVNVFGGTTIDDVECTFECVNLAEELDVRRLWKLLEPVPGLGGGGTGAAKTPSGYTSGGAVGSPPAASSGSSSSATSGFSSGGTGAAASSDAKAKSKDPNPGPRPPTISVQYQPFAYHGITALARKEFTGPIFTETGSMQFKIKFIVDTPIKPAGAGAMAPAKPGDGFVSAGGGGAAGGDDAKAKNAQSGASGT